MSINKTLWADQPIELEEHITMIENNTSTPNEIKVKVLIKGHEVEKTIVKCRKGNACIWKKNTCAYLHEDVSIDELTKRVQAYYNKKESHTQKSLQIIKPQESHLQNLLSVLQIPQYSQELDEVRTLRVELEHKTNENKELLTEIKRLNDVINKLKNIIN